MQILSGSGVWRPPRVFSILYYAFVLATVVDATERPETDNVCVINLVGKPVPHQHNSEVVPLEKATFNCTGSKLPVPIRVHPSVLEAVTLQEGVELTTDPEVRGVLHFENIRSLTVLDSVFERLVGGKLAPVVFDKSAGLFHRCRWSKNACARSGGIYSAGGSLLHVYDSVFEDNEGESYGAVSSTTGCRTEFRNTKFLNNSGGRHVSGSGGFVSGAVFSFQNTLTVFKTCLFKSNVAAGAGAGAYTGVKRAVVQFHKCTIQSNSGTSGAVELADISTGTLNQTIFHKNQGTGAGAPIQLSLRSTLKIYESEFMKNVGASGVVAAQDGSDIEIHDASFLDNKGTLYGGAISATGGGCVHIHSCAFEANSGPFGGALYQERIAEAILKDCTFTENDALYSGGALHQVDVSTTELSNCSFLKNQAGVVGGALSQLGCGLVEWFSPTQQERIKCQLKDKDLCEDIKIDGCLFRANVATSMGNSLFQERCKRLSVVESTFPDEKNTVSQSDCVERLWVEVTEMTPKEAIVLHACPVKPVTDRKLLI